MSNASQDFSLNTRIMQSVLNLIFDNTRDASTLPRLKFSRKYCVNEALMITLFPAVLGFFACKVFYDSKAAQKEEGIIADAAEQEAEKQEKHSNFVIGAAFAENPPLPNPQSVPKPKKIEGDKKYVCSNTNHRANLVDRDFEYLAIDIESLANLTINTRKIAPLSKQEAVDLAKKLEEILPTKSFGILHEALISPKRKTHISANLTPKQVEEIMRLEGDFSPAFEFTSGMRRIYPMQELFAHTLGYMHQNYCPASGLELALNERIITSPQQDIRLSLDSDIQYILLDELRSAMQLTKAEASFGIMMNPNTGEVLGEVSLPFYDPNQARAIINQSSKEWEQKSKHWGMLATEKGSVMKVFNTALALENDIPIDKTYDTDKDVVIAGKSLAEPYPPRFDYDMVSTLIKSSNRGAALMAQEIGEAKQLEFMRRIALIGDQEFQEYAAEPNRMDSIYRAIGYAIDIKPLKLLASFSSIVNGGCLVKPSYLYVESQTCTGERVYDEGNAQIIRDILLTNVVHRQGTGKSAYRSGTMLGLKTGTANVHVFEKGYSKETHSTIIGMFPTHAPKYALIVGLHKPYDAQGVPANAGTSAAPVAGNIADRVSRLMQMRVNAETLKHLEQRHVMKTQFDDEIRIAQQ